MDIRQATRDDCLHIARLTMIAGDGLPECLWADEAAPGEPVEAVGMRRAESETEHYSYRNAWLATVKDQVAGLLLAYRLPEAGADEDLDDLPPFIRPLVELEQCVPGSFYVNILGVYPAYRDRGLGTALMARVDPLATEAGCTLSSIEVFASNTGALRLYERLGYSLTAQRDLLRHPCTPDGGEVLLLTRPVRGTQAR
jgi:ribosomal protein S18 acetylase RimI-like enzyme